MTKLDERVTATEIATWDSVRVAKDKEIQQAEMTKLERLKKEWLCDIDNAKAADTAIDIAVAASIAADDSVDTAIIDADHAADKVEDSWDKYQEELERVEND